MGISCNIGGSVFGSVAEGRIVVGCGQPDDAGKIRKRNHLKKPSYFGIFHSNRYSARDDSRTLERWRGREAVLLIAQVRRSRYTVVVMLGVFASLLDSLCCTRELAGC